MALPEARAQFQGDITKTVRTISLRRVSVMDHLRSNILSSKFPWQQLTMSLVQATITTAG